MAWESRPRSRRPPVPNVAYHEPATIVSLFGACQVSLLALKNDLFIDVAVAAEVDDVRMASLSLRRRSTSRVPGTMIEFQCVAELSKTNFLIDLSKFSIEIERIASTRIGRRRAGP